MNARTKDDAQRLLEGLEQSGLLKTQGWVAGSWVDGAGRFDVVNPAHGAVLAAVANMDGHDAVRALAGAQQAWPAWRGQSARLRSRVLRNWYDLLVRHTQELAHVMTLEQGKPLAEARAEVAYAASFVEWFAEEARRVYGETMPADTPDRRFLTVKQPIGVCAAITPWNFPLAMLTRKVAPALAAGCPVVLKPSEHTPLTALMAAELARRAGVPDGVLSVLPADAERSIRIGAALCASPAVRHLSFTGSTATGRILMAQCAPTIKALSLELGGNAPFIVFDDADVDAAVEGAMAAKFRNGGQACVAANRFFVQSGIYERFVSRLAARVAALKVGDGLDDGVAVGPMINAQAVRKIARYVDDASERGARIVTGGQALGDGRFFAPTVLADVDDGMLCACEEVFGPVAGVLAFESESEVVERVNATDYGLAAYVYSGNLARAWRVMEAMECGMVGINTGMISAAEAPFGGVKQSGLGREGSRYGMEDYLEIKYACLGGMDA